MMIEMIGGVSFSIQADPEDKSELLRRLSEKGVKVRHFGMDSPTALEWIFITFGALTGLIEIYQFLKGKKDKNIEIKMRIPNRANFTITSKNAEELKVYIDEYENN